MQVGLGIQIRSRDIRYDTFTTAPLIITSASVRLPNSTVRRVSAIDVFVNEAGLSTSGWASAPGFLHLHRLRLVVGDFRPVGEVRIYICIYVCDIIVRVFRCVGGEICSHGGEGQVQVQGVGLVKGVGTCRVAGE